MLYTFYANYVDVNLLANMFRAIAAIQRVQLNSEQGTITVRATLDQLIAAQRILDLNDRERPQLILDIDILAVSGKALPERAGFPSAEDYSRFKERRTQVLLSQALRASGREPVELSLRREPGEAPSYA